MCEMWLMVPQDHACQGRYVSARACCASGTRTVWQQAAAPPVRLRSWVTVLRGPVMSSPCASPLLACLWTATEWITGSRSDQPPSIRIG